jgi:hypothetical protein
MLLRALNSCISFLLLLLLGCRQFCPVFVFPLLCFALANCAPSACWCSTVVSSGLACSICTMCSSMLYCYFQLVSLCFPSACFWCLLEFPVSVVSVLICAFCFAFCPVAVYTMILCSCRALKVVFVTCNELSQSWRLLSTHVKHSCTNHLTRPMSGRDYDLTRCCIKSRKFVACNPT